MSQLAGVEEERERGLQQSLRSSDPWVRAGAQGAHDFVLREQGGLESGVEARRAALRGFEEVGDRWGLVMTLLPTGAHHSVRGEHDEALAAFEWAVAISNELGTEEHLLWAKDRLARERRRTGDLEGALRDIRAAMRLPSATSAYGRALSGPATKGISKMAVLTTAPGAAPSAEDPPDTGARHRLTTGRSMSSSSPL